MANRERVILSLVAMLGGLMLTGCRTHPYSKLENEVYNCVGRFSRRIPKGFTEEVKTEGSSEIYVYGDSFIKSKSGKGRFVNYTLQVGSPSNLFAAFLNLDDVPQWLGSGSKAPNKINPNSYISFIASRPREDYDDPEWYSLQQGSDAVGYYRKKRDATWIKLEAYDLIIPFRFVKEPSYGGTGVPTAQVQRYIDLAERFDKTYSLKKQ